MIARAIDSLNATQNGILGEGFDFNNVLGAASLGNSDDLLGPLTTFVSILLAFTIPDLFVHTYLIQSST